MALRAFKQNLVSVAHNLSSHELPDRIVSVCLEFTSWSEPSGGTLQGSTSVHKSSGGVRRPAGRPEIFSGELRHTPCLRTGIGPDEILGGIDLGEHAAAVN